MDAASPFTQDLVLAVQLASSLRRLVLNSDAPLKEDELAKETSLDRYLDAVLRDLPALLPALEAERLDPTPLVALLSRAEPLRPDLALQLLQLCRALAATLLAAGAPRLERPAEAALEQLCRAMLRFGLQRLEQPDPPLDALHLLELLCAPAKASAAHRAEEAARLQRQLAFQPQDFKPVAMPPAAPLPVLDPAAEHRRWLDRLLALDAPPAAAPAAGTDDEADADDDEARQGDAGAGRVEEPAWRRALWRRSALYFVQDLRGARRLLAAATKPLLTLPADPAAHEPRLLLCSRALELLLPLGRAAPDVGLGPWVANLLGALLAVNHSDQASLRPAPSLVPQALLDDALELLPANGLPEPLLAALRALVARSIFDSLAALPSLRAPQPSAPLPINLDLTALALALLKDELRDLCDGRTVLPPGAPDWVSATLPAPPAPARAVSAAQLDAGAPAFPALAPALAAAPPGPEQRVGLLLAPGLLDLLVQLLHATFLASAPVPSPPPAPAAPAPAPTSLAPAPKSAGADVERRPSDSLGGAPASSSAVSVASSASSSSSGSSSSSSAPSSPAPAPRSPAPAAKAQAPAAAPALRESAAAEASLFGDLFSDRPGADEPSGDAAPAPAGAPAERRADEDGDEREENELLELCKDVLHLLESYLCADRHPALAAWIRAALAPRHLDALLALCEAQGGPADVPPPLQSDAEFRTKLRALCGRLAGPGLLSDALQRHLLQRPCEPAAPLRLPLETACLVARVVVRRHLQPPSAPGPDPLVLSLLTALLGPIAAAACAPPPAVDSAAGPLAAAPQAEVLQLLQLAYATAPPAARPGLLVPAVAALGRLPGTASAPLPTAQLLVLVEYMLHRYDAPPAAAASAADLAPAERNLLARAPSSEPPAVRLPDVLAAYAECGPAGDPAAPALYDLFVPGLRAALPDSARAVLAAAEAAAGLGPGALHKLLLALLEAPPPPPGAPWRAALLADHLRAVVWRLLLVLPPPPDALLAPPPAALLAPGGGNALALRLAQLSRVAFAAVRDEAGVPPPGAYAAQAGACLDLLAWTGDETVASPAPPLTLLMDLCAAFLARFAEHAAARQLGPAAQMLLAARGGLDGLLSPVLAALGRLVRAPALAGYVASPVAAKAVRAGLSRAALLPALDQPTGGRLARALDASHPAPLPPAARTQLQLAFARVQRHLPAPSAALAPAPAAPVLLAAAISACHAALAALLELAPGLLALAPAPAALSPPLQQQLLEVACPLCVDSSLAGYRAQAEALLAAAGLRPGEPAVAAAVDAWRARALGAFLEAFAADPALATSRSCDPLLAEALASLAALPSAAAAPPPVVSLARLSLGPLPARARDAVLRLLCEPLAAGGAREAAVRQAVGRVDEALLDAWLRSLLLGPEPPAPAAADLLRQLGADAALAARLFASLLRLLPAALDAFVPSARPFVALLLQLAAARAPLLDSLLGVLLAFLGRQAEELRGPGGAQWPAARLEACDLVLKLLEELLSRALARPPLALRARPALPAQDEGEEAELWSKCCTFRATGASYADQHWYFCYTCGLTFTEGCCSVCARVCHRGHDLSYSRRSSFYCDCGAGSKGAACKALAPRPRPAEPAAARAPPAVALGLEPLQAGDEAAVREVVLRQLGGGEPAVLALFEGLLQRYRRQAQEAAAGEQSTLDVLAQPEKRLALAADLAELRRSLKPGALPDVRLRYEGVRPEWRQLARVPLAANGRGQVAAAMADRLELLDLSRLADDQPQGAAVGGKSGVAAALDKAAVRVAGKWALPFEVHSVAFNPAHDAHLLAYGLREVHVLTVSARHELLNHLRLDLSLEALGDALCVLSAAWVPGSQVRAAVVTTRFVKVYDLSKDLICPAHHVVPPPLLGPAPDPDLCIRDALVVPDRATGAVHVVCLLSSGQLFAEPLPDAPSADGRRPMSLSVPLPAAMAHATGAAGLAYLASQQALVASFEDSVWLTRYRHTTASLAPPVLLAAARPDPGRARVPLCTQWLEWPAPDGGALFMAGWARRANLAAAVRVDAAEVRLQPLKPPAGNARVEGLVALPGARPAQLLLACDDGSLYRFDLVAASSAGAAGGSPSPSTQPRLAASDGPDAGGKAKRRGGALAGPRGGGGAAAFPVTFFEGAECVTPRVELGGADLLAMYSPAAAKARLAASDEYLVAPSAEGLTLLVRNPLPDRVLVGLRVLLGHASLEHLPRHLRLAGRTVAVAEGARRWYDLPLSAEEALAADAAGRELSLTLAGCHTAANAPILDSLEAYALPRDAVRLQARAARAAADGAPPLELRLATPLNLLALLHSAPAPPSAPPAPDRLLAGLLPEALADPLLAPLRPSLRALLRSLCRDRATYLSLKDSTVLAHAAAQLRAAVGQPLGLSALLGVLRAVRRLAFRRPLSLARAPAALAPDGLVPLAAAAFVAAAERAAAPDSLALLEEAAGALAELLYAAAYAELAQQGRPARALDALAALLLGPHDLVRDAAGAALAKLVAGPRHRLFPALDEFAPPAQPAAYSCDACGTSPIAGPRWHCLVCPDTDLCDRCFRAGALPTPAAASAHLREHALAEATGARAADDLLLALQLSLAPSVLAPAPAASAPPHEAQLRQALVQGLVAQPAAALRARDGRGLLPLMQVLHAGLSTARLAEPAAEAERLLAAFYDPLAAVPLGPGLPAPDLERHVLAVMLITHLLRPAAPASSSASRPAGAAAPAPAPTVFQLALRAALLRRGAVALVHGALSRLEDEFRSAHARDGADLAVAADGTVGAALLTVQWRGAAPRSLEPFFTPPSAAGKPEDEDGAEAPGVFAEPLRVLAAALLDWLSALVQPVPGAPPPPALDERWRRLVTRFLGKKQSAAVRRQAKAILLQMCGGDKAACHRVRDEEALHKSFEKLERHLEGPRPPGLDAGLDADAAYDYGVRLVRLLTRLLAIAAARPRHWLRFSATHRPALPLLFRACFSAPLPDEAALLLLRILAASFLSAPTTTPTPAAPPAAPAPAAAPGPSAPSAAAGMPGPSGKAPLLGASAEAAATRPPAALTRSSHDELAASADGAEREGQEEAEPALRRAHVETLLRQEELAAFVDAFLLQQPSQPVRFEARALLSLLWQHATPAQRDALLAVLGSRVPHLPAYGRHAAEFVELLRSALASADVARPAQRAAVAALAGALAAAMRAQHVLLATHPNAFLYQGLARVLEPDGHWLESEPCAQCSDPEAPYALIKAEAARAESKFTATAVMLKLLSPHSIAAVVLRLAEVKKGARMPRLLHVYVSNNGAADLADLRGRWAEWRKVKTQALPAGQGAGEVRLELAVPVTARHLMLEFAAFAEPPGGAGAERLVCPRCNRPVTDRHGFCASCHESAFQCRQCRNINYDALNGFLCNECGHCRHASFSFLLLAKPSLAADKIATDEDVPKALRALDRLADAAHRKYQLLRECRRPLARLLAGGAASDDEAEPADEHLKRLGLLPPAAAAAPPGAAAAAGGRVARRIQALAALYGRECRAAADGLAKAMQSLAAAKRELQRYDLGKQLAARQRQPAPLDGPQPAGRAALRASSSGLLAPSPGSSSSALPALPALASSAARRRPVPPPPNACFGCGVHFLGQALGLADQLAAGPEPVRAEAVRAGLLHELLHGTVPLQPVLGRAAAADPLAVAARLVRGDEAASPGLLAQVAAVLRTALARQRQRAALITGSGAGSAPPAPAPASLLQPRDAMALLCRLCAQPRPAALWAGAVRVALSVFFEVVGDPATRDDPELQELLLLPCLALLHGLCVFPEDRPPAPEPGPEAVRSVGLRPSVTLRAWLGGDPDASFDAWRARHGRAAFRRPTPAPPAPAADLPAPTARPPPGPAPAPAPAEAEGEGDEAARAQAAADERRRVRERRLAEKYAAKWRRAAGLAFAPPPVAAALGLGLDGSCWLLHLLLARSSPGLRLAAAALAADLAAQDHQRCLALLSLLARSIDLAARAGEAATEFFQLFSQLAAPAERKLYLALHGFLPLVCRAIGDEVGRLVAAEAAGAGEHDVNTGLALHHLTELLGAFAALPAIRARLRAARLMDALLEHFLRLRGLMALKGKLTDDAARQLLHLLNGPQPETPGAPGAGTGTDTEDNRAFLAACVGALQRASQAHDDRTAVFILEQMCNAVSPPKAEAPVLLVLNKSATQEDFLRGAMTKNPYSSADMSGPLMRDVKNKICKDLDLRGLLEDDNGMELLVAGHIVKLDLPIKDVYDKLARRPAQPAGAGPAAAPDAAPMVVTYRLKGLDGEATEPLLEALPPSPEDAAAADPEAKCRVTAVLAAEGGAGLRAVVQQLRTVRNVQAPRDAELAALALRLLHLCVQVRANRACLVAQHAVADLLAVLRLAFRAEPAPAELLERLLLVIESVVHEANTAAAAPAAAPPAPKAGGEGESQGEGEGEPDVQEGLAQIRMFLGRLETAQVRANARMRENMTRLLPFLTYGRAPIIEALVAHFAPHVRDYLALPDGGESASGYMVQCLASAAGSIALDDKGRALKDRLLASGIPAALLAFVRAAAPLDAPPPAWEQGLRRGAVAQALVLLAALARGHRPTQALVAEAVAWLLRMEDTSAVERVPQLAEALLDALAQAGVARDRIGAHRQQVKAARAAQASQRRARVLAELGLSKQAGGNKVVAAARPAFLEELEEEKGLRCLSCQEGYAFKPRELFGFYTFSKRLPLLPLPPPPPGPAQPAAGAQAAALLLAAGRAGEQGYSTVTHFHVIHWSCHRDASKADKALKQPKEEWEGATIRNSQTKTNNLFPLQGAQVTDETYAMAVERYWANLQRLGKADGARFRLLCHDLKFLLLRFAHEESFSVDAKGGGRESNIKMVPFCLQMGLFLLDQPSAPVKRRAFEKSLSAFLQPAEPQLDACIAASAQADSAWYYGVSALFLLSRQEWKQHKFFLLKALLVSVLVEHRTGPPAADAMQVDAGGGGELFRLARPALLFLALLDKLTAAFKPQGPALSPPVAEGGVAHKPDEEWIVAMGRSIRTADQGAIDLALGVLKDFEEGLAPATSVQELLHELELLQPVLAASPSADAFVADIWAACKPK